jgi:acetyl esterase/lipase
LNKAALALLLCVALLCAHAAQADAQYLSHHDVASRQNAPADYRYAYGPDSLQFGDLRLPEGEGPHPVAIVIHGGCWLSIADLHVMDSFTVALAEVGVATWNIEYRPVDVPGGGWPGTFTDVARGVDHIREIAARHSLDLDRVVLTGHSAGGHLALWAGARHRLDEDSPLYVADPLKPVGVLCLAGPADLRPIIEPAKVVCGSDVIGRLLGGDPAEVSDRFAQASPVDMLPTGVRQIVVHGSDDPVVPPLAGQLYVAAADSAGEKVGLIVIPDAAHFEVVAPWTYCWPMIEASVLSLLAVTEQ